MSIIPIKNGAATCNFQKTSDATVLHSKNSIESWHKFEFLLGEKTDDVGLRMTLGID